MPLELQQLDGQSLDGAVLELRVLARNESGESRRGVLRIEGRLDDYLKGGLPRIEGRALVAVELGGRRATWLGDLSAADSVVLQLGPQGTVWGRIADWPGPDVAGAARVSLRSATDSAFLTRESVAVGADGHWELIVPASMGAFVLAFESENGASFVSDQEPVLAGERREVSFSWQAGVTFAMQALETGSLEPIPHPCVAWAMMDGEGRTVVGRGGGDEQGRVVLRGMRRGEVWLYLLQVGYSSQATGPVLVPWVGAEWCTLEFQRLGKVRGRVISQGEPVGEFTIHHWNAEHEVLTETFQGREDGSFELANVPVGERSFAASTPGGISSAEVSGVVLGEQPLELEMALGSTVEVRGRVLSGRGLDPVEGAQVLASLTSDRVPVAWVSEVRTSGDGRFSGLVAPRDAAAVQVLAEGYEAYFQDHSGVGEGPLDLGDVLLRPLDELRVRITAVDEGLALDGFRARLFRTGRDEQAFDAEGRTTFAEVSLDQGATVQVIGPGVGNLYFVGNALQEAAEEIVVPVDTGRTVTVRYADDIHIEPGGTHQLTAEYTLGASGNVWAQVGTGDGREASFRMLPGGTVVFSLYHEQEDLAYAVVSLPAAGDQEIVLHSPASLRRLHLRNADGTPYEDEWVMLRRADAGPEMTVRPDVIDGSIAIPQGIGERFWVHAWDWNTRTYLFERVDLQGVEGDPTIEFAADGSLQVRLVERGSPAVAVEAMVLHPESFDFLAAEVSDGTGHLPRVSLSSGSYRVRVDQPGYWWDEHDLPVNPGSNDPVLEVRRTGNAELRVSRGGVFVPGVATRWTYEDWGEGVDDWLAAGRVEGGCTSDELGRVRLAGLPNGRYRVEDLESGAVTVVEVPPHGEGTGTLVVP